MPSGRGPYGGTTRKLVLAFDVGTTFSGISYSILDPGQVPEIRGVTRFPAQEKVGGSSKIPTIIYYDKSGKVRAVGAEATRDELQDLIEEEGWVKAEWHALTTYITDSHVTGSKLWASVESNIEYVLTHPNGWEGAQQQQMRRAAVKAGLVPDNDEGHARIRFVTEGEASLHFCIRNGLTTEALKKGGGVLIVDAGGGTIDLSAYGEAPNKKGAFEEIATPQCHLQGSVYVTARAKAFLHGEERRTYEINYPITLISVHIDFLKDTKFADDVEAMTTYFDKSAKLTFNSNPLFIKFGSARDRDPKLRIRGGQLTLLG
ncbi:hypothetical protein C0989_008361 [Termitomyces sp. Mn162]|nr:hypothetical protein C0989_008361 [Termitomyces sp. Mn162]